MDRDPTLGVELDTATPSVARTYDYLLGGKDNYEVDRQAVEMLRMVAPEAPLTARMNREFGKRAVRYIAEQVGSGSLSIWEVASPRARPACMNLRSAALTPPPMWSTSTSTRWSPHTTARCGPSAPGWTPSWLTSGGLETVLNHPGDLQALIDFNKPVGVVIFSVLDVIEDKDNPLGIFRQFRERMTPGSYLGISQPVGTQRARRHSPHPQHQPADRVHGSKLPARRRSPAVLRRLRPRQARTGRHQ